MGRHKKWPNEEMWAQAVAWKKGGLTYTAISGQLARTEYLKKYNLMETPSEDTIRREVVRRLASEEKVPSDATWMMHQEQSGHWPSLRKVAENIQQQMWTSLEQLLGFPEMDPKSNSALALKQDGKSIELSFDIQGDVLFHSLNQHLSSDALWDLIERWDAKVKVLYCHLNHLCEFSAKEQTEQLSTRGLDKIAKLTERFNQTAVLAGVEKAIFGKSMSFNYDVEQKGERWSLRWERGPISYLIADTASPSVAELLKALHHDLQETVTRSPNVGVLKKEYKKVLLCQESLDQELERVRNFATFPGRCDLCYRMQNPGM